MRDALALIRALFTPFCLILTLQILPAHESSRCLRNSQLLRARNSYAVHGYNFTTASPAAQDSIFGILLGCDIGHLARKTVPIKIMDPRKGQNIGDVSTSLGLEPRSKKPAH
ncbi:hypothetical protein EJ06DRAFT_531395 [Trichodelitschia bisporula]|uniref:Uncharacterized protein n=1 Tax=Trichodelitschia bisporula TaxID=703511 RepID=A0A6G1HSQ4_9PEZI|nr:hypothetical protein EJ06DRAFT_531395 [Trichodelitschia bisporula]